MMPTTAVLLAGGRGTRLGTLTESTPKPLLDVAGRPFVFFLLDYLESSGINRVVISTGYLAEQFERRIGNAYGGMQIEYAVEREPLGTGGAIMHTLQKLADTAFVLNADTLFRVSLSAMYERHAAMAADITVAVRQVPDVSRFGAILMQGSRVVSFAEKGIPGPGVINGGVYLITPSVFSGKAAGAKFSFEADFLPAVLHTHCVAGFVDSGYFIDMGIPMDFARARLELATKQAL